MKLLNKSIRLYIFYATALLIIAIPILYFAIQYRVAEEVDENLAEQKEKIISKLQKTPGINSLLWLENFEPDVTLVPLAEGEKKIDSFYTITSFDKIANENSPYRVLESSIVLQGKPYTMQMKSSLLDSEDLIESIVKIVAVLILLIISGLILINRLLSKKLWKPFYNTIHQLEEFKIETDDALPFRKTGVTEFDDLNNAIAELTHRNAEMYQSQKEFTENASHEIQTPLAVLQGKLDLLMQTVPLTHEQYDLIGDIADANQRMKRLNRTLLLLTKIENNQFNETESIPVRQVVEKLVEQLQLPALEKNITVVNEFTSGLVINANRILFEIMLGNILNNAIKHNIKNGNVIITGNENEICFANTGGRVALNQDRIFERFQKQTSDHNSIGLGLQIAKKIAAHYFYTICYTFQDQRHYFSITIAP